MIVVTQSGGALGYLGIYINGRDSLKVALVTYSLFMQSEWYRYMRSMHWDSKIRFSEHLNNLLI